MRRSPIVVTATVLTTAAVLLFRPRESVVPVDAADAVSKATVTQSGTSTVAIGAPITSRFGTTQVKVTIAAGKIVDVQAVRINSDEEESVRISNAAIPTLRQEVLSKQSAAVDTVSGATITSQAYQASLQSALDKAGFKAADGSAASTAAPTEDPGRHGHDRGFGG
jgi:uncharacterized protein with FMN-binding domain